jgi:serine/threonine protein phosphatase PrpC
MNIKVGARSDIGRLRQRNEDAYLVKDSLFVVADGMGGHRGGDVASTLALETIESVAPAEVTLEALVQDIKQANQALMDRGEADRELRGMGTTITAVIAEDAKVHVAHVGDSRAYLLRGGALQQLTEDHTLVQRMVREGRLTEDEAARHPQRSVLTRALGVDEDIPVDELTLDVRKGDRLLLCTDGLTNMVDRDRLKKILARERDPQVACDKLIDAANRAGGDDNITAIVLDFEEDVAGSTTTDGSGSRTDSTEDGAGAASSGTASSDAAATGPPEEAPSATRSVTAIREEPESEEAPRRRPRIRWRRVIVWAAVLVVLIAGALVGARVYIDRQWYVGEANGRVAIYNGIPTTVVGVDLSHAEQLTNLDARQAMRLQPWSGLDDGMTARSFSDAQRIVEQIRRDLQAGGTG